MPAQGDGSLGYHLIELETMVRLNIPAVIVVSNNSAWGMVYADQRRVWGRDSTPGAGLGNKTRYEVASEGLGCAKGEYVENPDEIRPALERALERAKAHRKPVLVNVITDVNTYIQPWPWWLLPETEGGEPFKGMGL